MEFRVITSIYDIDKNKRSTFYLIEDNWNDWFEYKTLYSIHYVNSSKEIIRIGSLKIGSEKLVNKRPNLSRSFRVLDDNFFSLGQDSSYYKNLHSLGEVTRMHVLRALNDVALNEEVFKNALEYSVTKSSLLRDISPLTVRGNYRKLAHGHSELSEYNFYYKYPKQDNYEDVKIDFSVKPNSNPPSNIHVLIGRNGVGKTYLINNMIQSLLYKNKNSRKYGKFLSDSDEGEIFANLISVTFSAFDETKLDKEKRDKSEGINFSYIGLKRFGEDAPKSPRMLKKEFLKSLELCRATGKDYRWKEIVNILQSDPMFREADIINIMDKENDFKENAASIFNRLSSGHKIILLTVTRLVETVQEKSFVILDEPEGHLHPPLLSAFIRAVSKLLIMKNGVALIATHSPVVLQEVPKECVWKIRRNGRIVSPERLEIESFGENIGTLTQEVFGLEVSHSGFHSLLSEVIDKFDDYDEAKEHFNGQLGKEASNILRTLLYLKRMEA